MQTGQLNGIWIPIKQEMGGKELPTVAFEKQQLTITDSSYTFVAESVDKGELKYSSGKMDIYGKEGVNTGKHFTALYKYENEILTICYNLKGDKYPEAFETKGNPLFFMSVFKRSR
ncbi:MAG TPA: hypothetical protein PLA68_14005 [Panacibacter sp.]|nr:hypothetical protein [Panacibacter sp.]